MTRPSLPRLSKTKAVAQLKKSSSTRLSKRRRVNSSSKRSHKRWVYVIRLGFPPMSRPPESVADAFRNEKAIVCNNEGINCAPHTTVYANLNLIRFFQKQSNHDGTMWMEVENPADAPRLAAKRNYQPPKDRPTIEEMLHPRHADRVCLPDGRCDLCWKIQLNEEEINQAKRLCNTEGIRAVVQSMKQPFQRPSHYLTFIL